MKTERGIGWVLAGVLGAGVAGAAPLATTAGTDPALPWPALHARLRAAWHGADARALTELVADDVQVTEADGRWLDRAQVLARPANAAALAYTDHGIAARHYGTLWLVEGVLEGAAAGAVVQARYSAAYVAQRGAWRLVWLQFTPIRGSQPTDAQALPAPVISHPWRGAPPAGDDHAVLHALNADYVQAFRAADVAWYDAHLAPDYHVVSGDGSRRDRDAALADFATPYYDQHIRSFPVDRVQVRLFGDVALIHAENAYTLKDGRRGINRYTDTWWRRDGRWWCVAAHITVHQPPR